MLLSQTLGKGVESPEEKVQDSREGGLVLLTEERAQTGGESLAGPSALQ